MIRCLTPRGVRPSILLALVFLSLLLFTGQPMSAYAQTKGDSSPLFSREIQTGLTVVIDRDGSLRLVHSSLSDPLLTATVPAAERRTRLSRQTEGPFVALVAEGVAGGRYGFSSGADDDGEFGLSVGECQRRWQWPL